MASDTYHRSSKYRKQAADEWLEVAESVQPAAANTLSAAGFDVAALVALAETAVGAAHRVGTDRTLTLPSTRRDERGSVPVRYTLGHGTEADFYPILDGAPVGQPESLEAARREARAAATEHAWAEHNARAEAGLATTRAQRRNARRAAQRIRRPL